MYILKLNEFSQKPKQCPQKLKEFSQKLKDFYKKLKVSPTVVGDSFGKQFSYYCLVIQLQLKYRNSLEYRKTGLLRFFPVFESVSVFEKFAGILSFLATKSGVLRFFEFEF